MLRSCRKLIGYQIHAKDGPVGELYDLYFDLDNRRMIDGVVNIGNSRIGLRVLIPPNSFHPPDHDRKILPLNLSKTEVISAPDWDSEKPVYRERMFDFGLNYYAPALDGTNCAPAIMGLPLVPSPFGPRPEIDVASSETERNVVRSFREISGYIVWGADGRLGEFVDFVLADGDWRLPYMVVHAGSGDCRRSVLMPTSAIRYISWDDRMILTDVSQKLIRTSPYFEAAAAIRS